MARKSKFDDIDSIMSSAAMSETVKEYSDDKLKRKNDVLEINVANIVDNPFQPRLQIKNEELIELANSINENGLLQPIILNKLQKNKYELIAGHRRLEAHKLLKRKTIKSIIVMELSKDDPEYVHKMAINALIENIQRQDLDILETAISMQNLLNEKIFKTKDELAKATGKNNAYISKVLSILKLDDEIIKDLEINKSIKDIEALYELQKIDDKKVQYKLYNELIKGNFSRQELREYNKKQKQNKDNKIIVKKIPYALKVTNKNISLSTNLDTLNEKEKELFEKDIKNILKKYGFMKNSGV